MSRVTTARHRCSSLRAAAQGRRSLRGGARREGERLHQQPSRRDRSDPRHASQSFRRGLPFPCLVEQRRQFGVESGDFRLTPGDLGAPNAPARWRSPWGGDAMPPVGYVPGRARRSGSPAGASAAATPHRSPGAVSMANRCAWAGLITLAAYPASWRWRASDIQSMFVASRTTEIDPAGRCRRWSRVRRSGGRWHRRRWRSPRRCRCRRRAGREWVMRTWKTLRTENGKPHETGVYAWSGHRIRSRLRAVRCGVELLSRTWSQPPGLSSLSPHIGSLPIYKEGLVLVGHAANSWH